MAVETHGTLGREVEEEDDRDVPEVGNYGSSEIRVECVLLPTLLLPAFPFCLLPNSVHILIRNLQRNEICILTT